LQRAAVPDAQKALWMGASRHPSARGRDGQSDEGAGVAPDAEGVEVYPAWRNGCHSTKGSRVTRRICIAVLQRGRCGTESRRIPASAGVRRPLRRLHVRHETTRFSQEKISYAVFCLKKKSS